MPHDVGGDRVIQGAAFAVLAVGYHRNDIDIHLVCAVQDFLRRLAVGRAIKLNRYTRIGKFNAVVAEEFPALGSLGDFVAFRVIMKQNDFGIETHCKVQYTREDGG